MRLLAIGLILVVPIVLGACNTVGGFGQDLSAAGRALSSASDKVTGREPQTAVTPPPAPAQGTSAAPQSLSTPRPLAPKPEEPK